MQNTFKEKRVEALLGIAAQFVQDVAADDGLVVELEAYLDKEIRAAYGRGLRDGKKPQQERPSARAAGKLKPVVRRDHIDVDAITEGDE